jgi:hypothetical protein
MHNNTLGLCLDTEEKKITFVTNCVLQMLVYFVDVFNDILWMILLQLS